MATTRRRAAARPKTRALTATDIAWLAAPPAALVLLAAVLALGPPVGTVLFGPSGLHVLPAVENQFFPESTEHARYVIVLLGPLMVSGAVLLLVRRSLRASPDSLRAAVGLSQLLAAAFLAATVYVQETTIFQIPYYEAAQHVVYFTQRTLVVAAAIALLLMLALRHDGVAVRAAAALRDTPRRHVAAFGAALLFVAIWELTAFNTEATIGTANEATSVNFSFWLDETFAVLNGQPPLVGINAQYGQLWPYLVAGVMRLTTPSLGAYSAVMVVGACGAMLAVFAVLRRVARSPLAALAIFMPFVATSFFMERGPLDNRYGPANLFSLFPMRHGGPYVLAWLCARHLDGARPRYRPLLFLLAGLVAINNVEFGIPAFGATLALFVWTSPHLGRDELLRLGRDAALGIAGAVAAVSLLTLVVAGSLPDLAMVFTYAKRYGLDGFGMMPMRPFGLHLAFYATFAAAIVLATVRAVRGEERVMTGMLAWAGIFGLGGGSYFVGRSHPEVLIDIFSAWSLTVGLLLVVVVRGIRARPSHLPSPVELAVLFAFGLMVCSLAQTPTPWSQIDRLGKTTPQPMFVRSDEERDVARATAPGEHVAIDGPLGHRIAYDIGIVDVMPYSDPVVLYEEQLQEVVDALHDAHGHKIFFAAPYVRDEIFLRLQREGFRRIHIKSKTGIVAFSDAPRPARR